MNCVPMSHNGCADDVTEDAVLGGRLRLRQPRRGHRVGHDAILLAAATPARSGDHVVDLGAGVGAAGLAVAVRVPGISVALVEVDAGLVSLAADNARLNGLADRALPIRLDVGASPAAFAAAGLAPGSARRVLMNPPFNDPQRANLSPDAVRRRAHAGGSDLLAGWVTTAHRLLAPQGTLTLIWRADAIGDVLRVVDGQFGGLVVLPVHPRPDRPAIRILVQGTKGSRAPLELRPGLMLNDGAGRPASVAETVLRDAAALPLAAC